MKSGAHILRKKEQQALRRNGIILGHEAAMKVSMVSEEPNRRNHGLSIQQWQEIWGLEGWDGAYKRSLKE